MAYVAGQKLRASDLGQLNTCGQYQATAQQTLGTGADIVLAYGQTNIATSLITVGSSGAGNSFTLGKAGIWAISVCERFVAAATGERDIYLAANNVFLTSAGVAASSANPNTYTVNVIQPFNNGDVITVQAFQNSGGNVTRDFSLANAWGRLNIVWLGG